MQRTDLAHGIAHAMRSALSRAALAAGQLERDAVTPRTRRLAGSVAGAVAELDRLVSDAVALLAAERRPLRCEDLRPVLGELRARHAAALAARGVAWAEAAEREEAPLGDAALARRAGASLLRVAAAWAGAGGSVALALDAGIGSWSLATQAQCRGVAAPPPPERVAELRALAGRAGGALEIEQSPSALLLRLRFASETTACPAS